MLLLLLLLLIIDLVIMTLLVLLASSSVWLMMVLSATPEAFRSALIQLFLTFDVTDDRFILLLSYVYGDYYECASEAIIIANK